MSIQIASCDSPAARQELRERTASLLKAFKGHYLTDSPDSESAQKSEAAFVENLKTFLFSLTGYQPTDEELKGMATS